MAHTNDILVFLCIIRYNYYWKFVGKTEESEKVYMSDDVIVGIVFSGVAVLFFIIGLVLLKFYKKKRQRCSETVTGTIVTMSKERGRSETSPTAYANYHCGIYEYEWNGNTYYAHSTVETTARPKLGKQMVLYVNPENPEEILEKRFVSIMPMVIMFALSGLCLLIGLLLIIV